MRESLCAYCARTERGILLDEWDARRNAPLTPEGVSHGSKKRVWWQCGRGHVWQAPVYMRTSNAAGCPYCAGRQPWPGENDLGTLYPHLAAQWDPEKNGDLTPAQVLPGSHRMAWWICGKGHRWRAQVKSRVGGSGCPVCANRTVKPEENDLATLFPALAAQWHPTLNGSLTPEMVTAGSRRKVWWQCELGHVWETVVHARTGGKKSGCPVCAGLVRGKRKLRYDRIMAELKP